MKRKDQFSLVFLSILRGTDESKIYFPTLLSFRNIRQVREKCVLPTNSEKISTFQPIFSETNKPLAYLLVLTDHSVQTLVCVNLTLKMDQ